MLIPWARWLQVTTARSNPIGIRAIKQKRLIQQEDEALLRGTTSIRHSAHSVADVFISLCCNGAHP